MSLDVLMKKTSLRLLLRYFVFPSSRWYLCVCVCFVNLLLFLSRPSIPLLESRSHPLSLCLHLRKRRLPDNSALF